MAFEITSMLSEETIEIGPGNKMFSHIPLSYSGGMQRATSL